jgi:HSP20 family protein
MAMVRYEPWNLYGDVGKEMSRLLARFAGEQEDDNSSVVTSHWAPTVDIKEDKDRFVLYADVPGVDPKDIEITMDNGVLTIKGERTLETEEERQGYKRMERARGTFYRRFSLPDSADPEHISARGRNGVLEVSIPKHEKLQPRKIAVEG